MIYYITIAFFILMLIFLFLWTSDLENDFKRFMNKIRDECAKMFPHTNSTFQKYEECTRHPEYYGVIKNDN